MVGRMWSSRDAHICGTRDSVTIHGKGELPRGDKGTKPWDGENILGHPGRFNFSPRVPQSRECFPAVVRGSWATQADSSSSPKSFKAECFPAVVRGSCNYGRSSLREMLHCLLWRWTVGSWAMDSWVPVEVGTGSFSILEEVNSPPELPEGTSPADLLI